MGELSDDFVVLSDILDFALSDEVCSDQQKQAKQRQQSVDGDQGDYFRLDFDNLVVSFHNDGNDSGDVDAEGCDEEKFVAGIGQPAEPAFVEAPAHEKRFHNVTLY